MVKDADLLITIERDFTAIQAGSRKGTKFLQDHARFMDGRMTVDFRAAAAFGAGAGTAHCIRTERYGKFRLYAERTGHTVEMARDYHARREAKNAG